MPDKELTRDSQSRFMVARKGQPAVVNAIIT